MAEAINNTFNPAGTFFPSNEAIPIEKAISVAVGMPQPLVSGVPRVKTRKMRAGAPVLFPCLPVKRKKTLESC
jgi:hypothetical protein